ncbi:MAG TPA: VWA domain-containing protein [Gemmatimonadaceae bacterium]
MIPYLEHPWALVAAPVLAAVIVLLLFGAHRRRARRLHRLGADPVIGRLVPPAAFHSPWRRAVLLGLAAACAGIAFAGPRWGTERNVERGSGIDIVLALDASLSMMATDERPDRLERMKEEARRLLAMSGNDRFGLIAFAGRSYILTPLTVDRGALELFLDNLDPSVVGQAGSSLARAIRQGTDLLLSTQTGSDRALVVMSDGEAFEPVEEVEAAAKHAAESGITVVTVGFGTAAGSTIPIRTEQGVTSKRDQNGEVVVTRYTPEMLQSAASAAGGTFIPATATDKASRVRGALATLRRQARAAQAGRDRKPRFQLFLIPAVLLVLLDTLLAERRGRRRPAPAAASTAAAVLLLLALAVPRAARADEGEEGDRAFRAGQYREAVAAYQRAIRDGNDSPRLEYNLGTALLAAGQPDDAIAALERAAQMAKDADLRYRALFNLGLVYLQQGRVAKGSDAEQALASAVDAYKRALRLRPGEHDAKWNYELANRQRKRSGGGGGGGGGGGAQQPQRPSSANAPNPTPRPNAGLDQRQAEQILNSAEREEKDVQARKQRENQPSRPPGGKDW